MINDFFNLILRISLCTILFGAGPIAFGKEFDFQKRTPPQNLGLKSGEKIQFRCVTDPPTTSLLAVTSEDEVIIGIHHAFGTEYMPIYRGITTPHDIPYIEGKGKVLMQMGFHGEVRWAKDDCKVYGPGLYVCYNGKPGKLGDLAFEYASFYTTVNETKFEEYTFRSLSMNLEVKVDKEYYTIPMDFNQYDVNSDECPF